MRRHAVDAPARPGLSPFGPDLAEVFMGGVLARVGAGDEAEPYARDVVERTHGLGFEDTGHALLALPSALATKDRPDPEQAAHVAGQAVVALEARPTSSVAVKAQEVAATLARWQATVPAVRELGEHLAAVAPRALPAGPLA